MNSFVNLGNSSGGEYVIATYWQAVSSASGTIQIPPGSTILLNQFPDLEDAVASETSGGLPTFNAATSGGNRVVSTFDVLGNYTLSPVPSFPIALVFRVLIVTSAIDYGSANVIVEDIRRPGGGGLVDGASNVGGGMEVFKQLTSASLQFRTLTAGTNVTISQSANNLTINASGGGGGNNYFPGGWV